jgi:hypothetical protein
MTTSFWILDFGFWIERQVGHCRHVEFVGRWIRAPVGTDAFSHFGVPAPVSRAVALA